MPIKPERVLTDAQKVCPDSIMMSYDRSKYKAKFEGENPDSFTKWVHERLVYPEDALRDGIQGRVVLSFTVDTDGTVGKVKVLRSLYPRLDAGAVRVVKP